MNISKKLTVIRVCLLLWILMISNMVSATNYYVSKSGNNTNDGKSLSSSFATIQHAANVVQPGETVFIREGEYREEINIYKSGDAQNPIIFTAYNSESVEVTTTDLLGSWTTDIGNIYKTFFDSKEIGRVGMTIFVDGTWLNEAHWSSEGKKINMLDQNEYGRIESYTSSTITDTKLIGYPDDYWNGAYVWAQLNSWSMGASRIIGFDGNSGRITFEDSFGFSAVDGKGYIIVDSYKALDAPGEWFYDEENKTLYIWPPNGNNPNSSKVEVKTRKECFKLNGHNYIQFDGIHFHAGDIAMEESNNIEIKQSHFSVPDWDFGPEKNPLVVAGLEFSGSNNKFINNEVVNGCGRFINLHGQNNSIVNNYFHDMGYNNVDGAAIDINNCKEGNLISHNTFLRFGHSVIAGPSGNRFIIEYNDFGYACMLTVDVGAIGFGNSSYNNSIIHHNVFYGMPFMSSGIYMDAMSSDIIIHHNILHNNEGWGLKINMPATNILSFNNTIYNDGRVDGMSVTSNLSADGVRFYNNIANYINGRFNLGGAIMESNLLTKDPKNFTNPQEGDFSLTDNSQAIDSGTIINGITDGYNGKAPDIGALEHGEKMWKYGHDFDNPPNWLYDWYPVVYSNFVRNSSFENNLDYWNTVSGSPLSLKVNNWNYKDEALGVSGWRSLELMSGDQVEQTISGLKPNTLYKVQAKARLIRKDIQIEKHDASFGSFTSYHVGNEYSFGEFNVGEWMRFDDIDFGTGTPLFNAIELGTSGDSEFHLEIRLDNLNGPLVAVAKFITDRGRLDISKFDIPTITGNHSIYLVSRMNSASDAMIDRIRLLNEYTSERITIGVKDFDQGSALKSKEIGYSYWTGSEGFIFKTGPSNDHATLFINKPYGALTGYVETVSIKEVETPRMAFKTHTIPGVIQTEDVDNGGQGIAYNVVNFSNVTNPYRPDIDVQLIPTTDANGNYEVSGLKGGEWLEYTIVNSQTGYYDVQLRYASENTIDGPKLILNDQLLGIFESSSSGGLTNWKTANLSNIFISSGSNKMLRIELPSGEINLNHITFIKKEKPIANFTAKVQANINEVISFSNTSKDATSYNWNFGDGKSSTLTSPTHTFTSPGSYTVKLTATNKAGSTSKSVTVTVVDPTPIPDPDLIPDPTPDPGTKLAVSVFSVKTADVVTGETLSFNNMSSNATSYNWSFGDGSTSTLANPTHAYSKLGTYTVILTATNEAGSVASSKNINVNLLQVSANFSVKTADVVTGETLTFNNTSANATSYSWNFGDGTTSTAANPTHAYSALGTYKVELTATSKAGTKKVSANVNVTLLPVTAKFSVKTADVVTGESLTFNNTSANATSYSWNFGDGSTSSLANPTHVYTKLGTYKVELTATSKAGSKKVSANVNVTLLPVLAKFSVKTADVVTGEKLTFNNTSANATSYSWNFGDGTSSTAANPTHAYNALGSYVVELIAKGPAGSTKTTSNINVNMEPVKANFTMDKAEVFTKEEISFNNTSSAADSYVWDFGDGITSAQTSPRHSYANSGTYSVVLTAKGLAGKSAKINSVLVKDEVVIPDPDPTPDPIVPAVAGFSMDKTTDIVTGEELIFTNTSKDATQYLWDFGDGNTSTLENPTHSYEKTGEYTVTMKASNEDSEATVSVTIEVNIEPVSTSFTMDKVEIYEGDSVRFSNTSLHASSYLWNFGDGETSTESNPTHTFTISGNYTVVLEASNKAGKMSHSETLSVIVKPAVAQFTVESVEVFTNKVISFTNTSIHATEYAWNLGDGNTSALKNPIHTYTTAGVYTVSLIASNKGGQSPEFTQEMIVSDEPVVIDPIEPENAAPVANSESFVTSNNTPIVIVLSATDVEEDVMTYEIISKPNNGVLTGVAPELMYTPNASYSGKDEFTFVANDGKVNSEMATIMIDVDKPTPKPINGAPKAIDQNITTDYNSNIEVTLEANDVEGDTLTFTVVEEPQNGFLLGKAPNVTYVPNENFFGADAFKFTASDADGISNLASINIVVNEPAPDPTPEPINIAPKASNQLLSTPFNVNLTIVLDATDAENDSLTYTTVSVPANGTLMGTAPNLVYLPNINFAGEDRFTFMASDSSNNSNVATISVTVEKAVEEPEEESALLGYWAFDEGAGNVAVDKSGNNYNGELINTQWKELGQVNGAVVFDGNAYVDLDEHIDAFTELNQGAISLWFKTDVEDAGRLITASNSKDFSSDLVLNCKDGFINYAVREENAAKLVVRSQFNTYNDNEWHNVVISINKSSNQMFIDGELSKVSYIVGTSSSSEFFSTVTNLDVLRIGNGEDKNNGNEDFFNGIQDEVKIYNQPLTEEEVKEQYDFVIASLPENAAPVAIQQNVQVIENYALNITLEGTDFNEDELTYSIMEYPLNGELTGEAPNLTYKPLEGYVGDDSFTFIVFDGEDESQEASINITVVDYELAESLSEGLIGHWALDEESGTISNDLSGNNYDGTTVNERWFKNGKVDGAMSLNGKGYINLDEHINAVQDLSDGSINLWFKTTESNAGRLFTASDKSDKSSDVMLDVFGGRVNFTVRDNEKLNLRVSTQQDNLNDGKWHHISVNVNPEGNLVYLDGNLADVYYTEGTASTSFLFSDVSDLDVLRFGNGEDADHGNEDYFNGSLDDVRLYSRALENIEVKSLFGRATDDNRKNPYLKETNLADISTWPNPAVNYVNIEFPDAGNFRVAIYDIKGKLMYLTDVVDNKTHAIGIGQYEIGMYFIKVTDLETDISFTQNILKREF